MQVRSFSRLAKPAAVCALLAGGAVAFTTSSSVGLPAVDQQSALPETLVLTGVVRDFRWKTESGGHVDFEHVPSAGYGHYVGMVADELDQDGKPVFAATGYKVSANARDAQGRNRMPRNKSYIDSREGDINGTVSSSLGGACRGAPELAQWFRDQSGVNLSRSLPLTLRRQSGSNIYTFDDRTDPLYSSKGGFFPINADLFGNSPGQSKNFGFTFELSTNFVYRRGTGQAFTFTGDDDVWVFIGGKLVIDIGGVHPAVSQTIELDRLNHLQDGQRYPLKFFFAERHTSQSNFRIDTTINLENAEVPMSSALFD
ncbi:MAG: fibro-slime domain-containing protein [Phycisphaerales bacterium]